MSSKAKPSRWGPNQSQDSANAGRLARSTKNEGQNNPKTVPSAGQPARGPSSGRFGHRVWRSMQVELHWDRLWMALGLTVFVLHASRPAWSLGAMAKSPINLNGPSALRSKILFKIRTQRAQMYWNVHSFATKNSTKVKPNERQTQQKQANQSCFLRNHDSKHMKKMPRHE